MNIAKGLVASFLLVCQMSLKPQYQVLICTVVIQECGTASAQNDANVQACKLQGAGKCSRQGAGEYDGLRIDEQRQAHSYDWRRSH